MAERLQEAGWLIKRREAIHRFRKKLPPRRRHVRGCFWRLRSAGLFSKSMDLCAS